jgi:very-short-patch-repair endonuclease
VAKFVARFGTRYDYSDVNVTNVNHHVTISCPDHGAFDISQSNFLASPVGCPACGKTRKSLPRISSDVVVERFRTVHDPGRYTYDRFVYQGQLKLATITCTRHGDFQMTPGNHGTGHGCTRCNNNAASKEENAWVEAIETALGEIAERSVRVSSRLGSTLDAVFGHVAVEYDGAYWHSLPGALMKDTRKTETALKDGFAVVRIRACDPKHDTLPDVPNARNIHVGNKVSDADLEAVINAIREARQ